MSKHTPLAHFFVAIYLAVCYTVLATQLYIALCQTGVFLLLVKMHASRFTLFGVKAIVSQQSKLCVFRCV